ncbi:MAG: carbon-nitrogen hydrolase family protein [Promethearchaeota archaeon]|jgi:predicted amidohydrolase
MKVACIQSRIHQSREKCYLEVEHLLKQLLNTHRTCEIVCLPERWVPFPQNSSRNFQNERGKDYSFIKNLASKYSIKIISGGIWEQRKKAEKPAITSYFFDENGNEIGRQDKIHLYSYEQEQFQAYNGLNFYKLKDSKFFAILICFDMAFFETPRIAVENGADILFSPTQIREDGISNWKVYLKARALENRVPIVACNAVGSYLDRKFPGNSKIISFLKGNVSPSKLKLVEGPYDSSGFVIDDIDLEYPQKLRKIRLSEKVNMKDIVVKKVNAY